MISLDVLEKTFQKQRSLVQALKRISFQVQPGEILGVIGKKDAGKTTLLRCIALLDKPEKGSIVIDHYPLSDLLPHARNDAKQFARQSIGILSQKTHLIESKTVYENIALPLELANTPKIEIQTIVKPLLSLLGLTDKSEMNPKDLSQAERKRIALGRALVNKPKILLCDEPTEDIEPKSALAFLQLLKEINERYKTSILICTEDIDVIKTLCHRVIVLHQGEIIEENNTVSFFVKPQSSLAKEWVKASTRLELPTALRRRLKPNPSPNPSDVSNPVLRLSFTHPMNVSDEALDATASKETLIAHVVQHFNLSINIMQAHLEIIGDESIGVMILEVQDEQNMLEAAILFLESQGLFVEVLGYASRTH